MCIDFLTAEIINVMRNRSQTLLLMLVVNMSMYYKKYINGLQS